ncbi:hypothetical protein EDB80DRAFT_161686 [Ilyonectria destructans]|nr:hypothetical protein EDB80DRAFT_161686 [Ilyonectria destructans]
MNDDVFNEFFNYIHFSESTESLWPAPASPAFDSTNWGTGSDFVTKLNALEQKHEPSSLNLVILKGSARFGAISIREEHFSRLLQTFRLPRSIVHAMFSNNGQLAYQIEHAGVDGDERPSALSIVIQTPHSPVKSLSLALCLSVHTNSAVGMLIVRDEQDAADIVKMVRSRQNLICLCPLYLLTVACEHSGRRNEKWRKSLDLSLVQIENHIGLPRFKSSLGAIATEV